METPLTPPTRTAYIVWLPDGDKGLATWNEEDVDALLRSAVAAQIKKLGRMDIKEYEVNAADTEELMEILLKSLGGLQGTLDGVHLEACQFTNGKPACQLNGVRRQNGEPIIATNVSPGDMTESLHLLPVAYETCISVIGAAIQEILDELNPMAKTASENKWEQRNIQWAITVRHTANEFRKILDPLHQPIFDEMVNLNEPKKREAWQSIRLRPKRN